MAAVQPLKLSGGALGPLDGTADDTRFNSVGVGAAANGTRGTLNFGTAARSAVIQLNDGTGGLDFTSALVYTFNNALRGPDGSLAAPAFAFTSETNSGLRRVAAGDVRITAAGADAAVFLSTARILAETLDLTTIRGGSLSGRTDASSLTISGGGVGTLQGLLFNTTASHTAASGAQEACRWGYTFAPTSGTAEFYGLNADVTINQTGGANGNYSAIRVNVTETAAGGSDNRLINLLVGAATRFAVSSVGSLALGNVTPSATAGRLSIKGGGAGTDALIEAVDATGASGFTIQPRVTASGGGTSVSVIGGAANTTGTGGGVNIRAGAGAGGGAEGSINIQKSDGATQYMSFAVAGSDNNVNVGAQVTQLALSSAYLTGGTATASDAARTESVTGTPGILVREVVSKVTEAFFTAAAATETKAFLTIPARAVVDDIWIEHTANFTGGALSAFTIEVGRTGGGTTDFYAATDVFAGAPKLVGDAAAEKATALTDGRTLVFSTSATTELTVTARATGGNVADATAGRVNIWVRYHVAPAAPA